MPEKYIQYKENWHKEVQEFLDNIINQALILPEIISKFMQSSIVTIPYCVFEKEYLKIKISPKKAYTRPTYPINDISPLRSF